MATAPKHIADVLKAPSGERSLESASDVRAIAMPKAQNRGIKRLSSDVLDRLSLRMTARYGHGWTSQFGADDIEAQDVAYAEWGEALAGLTLDQIAEGIKADAARGSDWPPSSTAFAAMCWGLPDLGQVRRELFRGGFEAGDFSQLVWSYLDAYLFNHSDQRMAEKLLIEAYESARKHVLAGKGIPTPTAAIAKQQDELRTPASDETVAACMAEIERAVGPLGEKVEA